MESLLLYGLKMLLCAAVLFGYYRLALYNERFHRWNRFYLLVSLCLSVVVPLVHIPVAVETTNTTIADLLAGLPLARGQVQQQAALSLQTVALLAVAGVSLLLCLRMTAGIAKVIVAYRRHT